MLATASMMMIGVAALQPVVNGLPSASMPSLGFIDQSVENVAGDILSSTKAAYLTDNWEDPTEGKHFFFAKAQIEQSPLFEPMTKVPKTILHIHSEALVTADWVIEAATYRDDVMTCLVHGKRQFMYDFLPAPPADCDWVYVADERAAWTNSDMSYDEMLYKALTIVTETPEVDYPTQEKVWAQFSASLLGAGQLLNVRPVFDQYLDQMCEQLVLDGTMYVEVRTLLLDVVEEDGSIPGHQDHTAQLVLAGLDECSRRYPDDFAGGVVIYTGLRHWERPVVGESLATALELRTRFGNRIAGFDLVGREDPGYTLDYFSAEFADAAELQAAAGVTVPYFFHAGETNWWDSEVGHNLVTAMELHTRRIGHGFALAHYDNVVEMMKTQGVSVEICPISNQVLKLVADLRNHPAAKFVAEGLPVTISPDDPSVFGISGVSYDYHEAFLAFGGPSVDMKVLKELSWNGLAYSAIMLSAGDESGVETASAMLRRRAVEVESNDGGDEELVSVPVMRKNALRMWNGKWKEFIQWVVDNMENDSSN